MVNIFTVGLSQEYNKSYDSRVGQRQWIYTFFVFDTFVAQKKMTRYRIRRKYSLRELVLMII